MSSSSSPEPPEPHSQEAARIALDEVEEAEALLEQHPPTVEKALGERQGGRGRRRGGGWITFAWGLPGFVWLGFFLIAPLVFIVLMSFWTPNTSTGFVKEWTLHNYGQLLHAFDLNNAYW
jgi:hypothetical protein